MTWLIDVSCLCWYHAYCSVDMPITWLFSLLALNGHVLVDAEHVYGWRIARHTFNCNWPAASPPPPPSSPPPPSPSPCKCMAGVLSAWLWRMNTISNKLTSVACISATPIAVLMCPVHSYCYCLHNMGTCLLMLRTNLDEVLKGTCEFAIVACSFLSFSSFISSPTQHFSL